MNRDDLLELGKLLDSREMVWNGETAGIFMARELLRIRNRQGQNVPLVAEPGAA